MVRIRPKDVPTFRRWKHRTNAGSTIAETGGLKVSCRERCHSKEPRLFLLQPPDDKGVPEAAMSLDVETTSQPVR